MSPVEGRHFFSEVLSIPIDIHSVRDMANAYSFGVRTSNTIDYYRSAACQIRDADVLDSFIFATAPDGPGSSAPARTQNRCR